MRDEWGFVGTFDISIDTKAFNSVKIKGLTFIGNVRHFYFFPIVLGLQSQLQKRIFSMETKSQQNSSTIAKQMD